MKMTTVSEAVKNSWIHIFSFDSAIPRSRQRETIGEVLKEINRIKDEMQTLHLRFADIEQGKLEFSSVENIESQFEKLRQQLKLHTLLISELRKCSTEIDELKHKEEYRLKEERELKNEIRKLRNDFHLLSETVNNRNSFQNSNLPGIISKIENLQLEFDSLNNRTIKNEKMKSEVDTLRRDIEELTIMKKNHDEHNYMIRQIKEEINSIQLAVDYIPQLKTEIQRKMNKTIQATNELKENFVELKDKFKVMNEERRQDHNVISQLATQAEQLRIQIQTIKMNQKDNSSSKVRQEELVNQCVRNIAKLAESVNNLQEKISNHLITLSVAKSNNYSSAGSKTSSQPKTPLNNSTPRSSYYEISTNNGEHFKKLINKSKNSPRVQKSSLNHFSLPETPSTQAPPILSSTSARLGSFFGNQELSGIISTSSVSNSCIESTNNSRPTTNNTCDQDENVLFSTIENDKEGIKKEVNEEDLVNRDDLKGPINFLEINNSVNSSEETNCTSSGENFLLGNVHIKNDMLIIPAGTERNTKLTDIYP